MASRATFLVTSSLMLLIMAKLGEGGSLGINFGRQTSQKLLPSMVVDMCLANGIKKVKLFSVNEGTIRAFSGSDIELTVAMPSVQLRMDNSSYEKNNAWISKYIRRFRNEENVNIRYICVGVEPFSMIERVNDDTSYVEYVVPILKNLEDIIADDLNLRGIVKLGIPLATYVLEPVSKPSEGDFRKEFKEKILEALEVFSRTDAPFMINIYPYFNVMLDHLPLEFGLFDKRSNYTIVDGDLVYTNIFDVKYDTLVWALRKAGYGNMKIMVSQVGWPTDGGPGATVKTAKRFYDGFLKKVASNQGTPLVPGADLDAYIYELADENQRATTRGAFERHYGIYDADGRPKFNIDFTLQGRDIVPESAAGVSYLPQRWCIVNKEEYDKADVELVKAQYTEACKYGDCTALAEGASCGYLEEHWKISYAFNMLFQMSNQEVLGDAACDFGGLGLVTNTKPDFEGCEFPVQILSTLFLNGMSDAEMGATLGVESDTGGERLTLATQLAVIIPLLWIVIFLHNERWL